MEMGKINKQTRKTSIFYCHLWFGSLSIVEERGWLLLLFRTMTKTISAAADVANEDVMMSSSTNEQTAKTPAAASNPISGSKTPVSSGGMTMRSGKKKKRKAFTATTPSRKRMNKRSADDVADDGDSNNNNNDGGGKKEGVAKKRRKTKDNATVENEAGGSNSDEDMDTDGDDGDEVSDNDVDMENNRMMATATKVRFETTKEAVAAAQLPESDDEEEDDDEDDEEEDDDDEEAEKAQAEAEAASAAAAAVNEQATGWRRLLTHRLRLPSQHTPGPPAVAESPGLPPPAGGRRLIFDTGVKKNKEINNNATDTTTMATTSARNKLLTQTRKETGTTKTNQSSIKSKANSSRASSSKNTSSVQQPTTPSSPPQSYPHFLLEELSKNHELKRDVIKCTMAWLVMLLALFMLGNVTNVMGDYAWDVREQSIHWSEWYGMATVESEVVLAIQESGVDSATAETTDNDDDKEVITVVDPNLLQQARAILRAQRMNQHDIQVFENATAELILAMKMLDSVEDELLPSSSSSASSSLPTLSNSVTDPVAIIQYIESMIDTQDVVVFSKSYCPYCKATKALFRDMGVQPTVIELDEMENGSLVQEILSQMTHQETVPNVYVKREHVGGNDDTQELAESGELQEMLSLPDVNMEQIKSKLDNFNSNISEKQQLLEYWEHALVDVEAALGSLEEGSASQHEANAALRSLSTASMVPVSAMAVDVADIHVPGEGCDGKDYTPLTTGKENVVVDVVGGVDVDALDVASDAPLLLEDARSAYDSLATFAQSTSEAIIGPTDPSDHARRWTQRLVKEECQKEGIDGIPSVQVDLPNDVAKKKAASSSPLGGAYNARAASNDIDRLLEIEDADRTGKFDYASVIHGARVLRRGPRATSLSLYESLPLINRLLAYSKLRFYGHPPEVALRPTTTMYAKGHCWSFGDEFSISRARRHTQDGLRGEYATLTVALSQEITVTEVMIDHVPRSIADGTSALKMFRVIGYEDSGAFGEPWELGSFQYDSKLGLQTFAIPSGDDVPKLKAVSLAVDSNWGAEYSCLYRFRVHGGETVVP